jgi:hypothetical protein
MATTYVRLKNRRGNRTDLPEPLAEGEIGLALDTRELYIGTGNQDERNRMVQVDSFLNAQAQTQSLIDTRLVMFKLANTDSFKGDGTTASSTTLNGSLMSKPATKTTPINAEDIVVTKFDINNRPTTVENSQYSISVGSGILITFIAGAIPENNSTLVVSKWKVSEIVTAIETALPNLDTVQTSATNMLYIDLTTGTGFVDIATSGYTQTQVKTALDALGLIDTSNTNANLNILGNISQLSFSSRQVSIDGTLLSTMDSPGQAKILSTFLNKALGTPSVSVASNIKIYTQDSRPEFDANQYIGNNALLKNTLVKNTSANVFTFKVADVNTISLDYSLKFGSAYAVGRLQIISDGSNVHYVDDRTETADTSKITFTTPSVSGGNMALLYGNSSTTTDCNMSYLLKRWLTS